MLMKFGALISILYFTPSICLNPKRLPNGKMYKFTPNKQSPSNDLHVISAGQASLITKNWLENIVAEVFNRENKNLQNKQFSKKSIFDYDELHIVTHINQLENYIQESHQESTGDDKKTLFLSWMPKGEHGRHEVLFIIVAFILVEKKEFVIRHLVQSPFWDPVQIGSNELKIALEAQNCKNNCTTINLDYLYENDLRYKLAWSVWNLNLDREKNIQDPVDI
jgi:hypothetical protein